MQKFVTTSSIRRSQDLAPVTSSCQAPKTIAGSSQSIPADGAYSRSAIPSNITNALINHQTTTTTKPDSSNTAPENPLGKIMVDKAVQYVLLENYKSRRQGRRDDDERNPETGRMFKHHKRLSSRVSCSSNGWNHNNAGIDQRPSEQRGKRIKRYATYCESQITTNSDPTVLKLASHDQPLRTREAECSRTKIQKVNSTTNRQTVSTTPGGLHKSTKYSYRAKHHSRPHSDLIELNRNRSQHCESGPISQNQEQQRETPILEYCPSTHADTTGSKQILPDTIIFDYTDDNLPGSFVRHSYLCAVVLFAFVIWAAIFFPVLYLLQEDPTEH